MKTDWIWVKDGLVLVEEGDIFRDAVFEDEGLGPVSYTHLTLPTKA